MAIDPISLAMGLLGGGGGGGNVEVSQQQAVEQASGIVFNPTINVSSPYSDTRPGPADISPSFTATQSATQTGPERSGLMAGLGLPSSAYPDDLETTGYTTAGGGFNARTLLLMGVAGLALWLVYGKRKRGR